jgi:PTH1 family peptidyl-tRNA hydrolase
MAGLRLIAGLGNPGREHERDRHHVGFWFVEQYARALGAGLAREPRYKALVGRARSGGGELLLVMPQTYMNLSGQAVVALARFYKIAPEETLVIHDELDFPPGTARLKLGGGVAGHNGLKDIAAQFGSPGFWRMRIGIGHPGDRSQVADWVLSSPSPDDRVQIEAAIGRGLEVMPTLVEGQMQLGMQRLHLAARPADAAKKDPAVKDPAAKDRAAGGKLPAAPGS